MIVGKDYEFNFDRKSFTDPEGGSVSYNVSGLPPGMTVDSASWKIVGTPNRAGTFTVTVKATDQNGKSTTDTFQMIVAANQPPQVVAGGIPDASHNVGQHVNINLVGFFRDPDASRSDVITISTGPLPEGLREVENGRLKGSTDVVGAHEIKVYAEMEAPVPIR